MKKALCAVMVTALATGILLAQDDGGNLAVKKPHAQKGGGGAPPTIHYHGGKVLGPVVGITVHAIYYGAVPGPTQTIINNFLSALGGSPQFNVNTTYYQQQSGGPNQFVSNFVTLGTVYNDTKYPLGSNLGNGGPASIVQYEINAGHVPLPAATPQNSSNSTIYLVMTSPDVKVPGVCTSYCAYHTSSMTIVAGTAIRYAYVPDPGESLSGKCALCDGNYAVYGETLTPNGDVAADEMTDSLMHEISESTTDPDITSWYTQNGEENGDLCNYNYGTTYPVTVPGTNVKVQANASLGGNNYLIQTIWPETNGACLNTYSPKP